MNPVVINFITIIFLCLMLLEDINKEKDYKIVAFIQTEAHHFIICESFIRILLLSFIQNETF